MKRLQHWFDQIIGIAEIEEQRRATAHKIFAQRNFNEASLALPACWRRQTRIIIGFRR